MNAKLVKNIFECFHGALGKTLRSIDLQSQVDVNEFYVKLALFYLPPSVLSIAYLIVVEVYYFKIKKLLIVGGIYGIHVNFKRHSCELLCCSHFSHNVI